MLTALYHATMYAISFPAILTMFATVIGLERFPAELNRGFPIVCE
jgi:hypothetical protein